MDRFQVEWERQKGVIETKRCQEPFLQFWQYFHTLLMSFWLLSDNQGRPSAETSRPRGAELVSFAPHRLPDAYLIDRLASSDQEQAQIKDRQFFVAQRLFLGYDLPLWDD